MELWQILLIGVAVAASFTVSAAAGLGGSLILVPALSLAIGTKNGLAMAALLLASNNVVKVVAYRRTLPIRKTIPVIIFISVGAFLGARLLVSAPDRLVTAAVLTGIMLTLVAERLGLDRLLTRAGVPALSLASGATSGFSGTSGPLKGVAVKSLDVDRLHVVGAASLASLAGDTTKSTVFVEAGLLDGNALLLAVALIPVMVAATLTGRKINSELGEQGYSMLFWCVMGGYSLRLILT